MRIRSGLVFCLAVVVRCALAEVPMAINYQGRLVNGTNLVNGTVNMALRLCDAEVGGSILYEDTNIVTVVDGLYSTIIGDNTRQGSLTTAMTRSNVYVEVVVNGTTLAPREQMTSVGFSLATRGISVTLTGGIVANPSLNYLGPTVICSTLGGGFSNAIETLTDCAFVGGGFFNNIETKADYAFLGGGESNRIAASADHAFLGGGRYNTISNYATCAVIGGGVNNSILFNSANSVIGGGRFNLIGEQSGYSTVAGGEFNSLLDNCKYAAIGGGELNIIGADALYATIPGGYMNGIGTGTRGAFAAGSRANAFHSGTFVWSDSSGTPMTSTGTNQFLIRAGGGVGIGTGSPGAALQVENTVQRSERLRLSGQEFFQSGHTAGDGPTLLLGVNRVDNRQIWIADSARTDVNSTNAMLRMLLLGDHAQIDALATDGATRKDMNVGGEITILSGGNVGIGVSNPAYPLEMHSGAYSTGSGQWVSVSDKNAKENFTSIDSAGILDRVVAMPVTYWNYKCESKDQRHIGPTAQDFYSSFGVGDNDRTLSSIDPPGVAFAAIQGLNAKLEQENATLHKEIDLLKARLDALEAR